MVTMVRMSTTHRQAKDFLTSIVWIKIQRPSCKLQVWTLVPTNKSKATQDTIVEKA